MAIGNQSGRDVEYEVQPSNPGPNLTHPQVTALAFTAGGGALTAYGCLGDGGRGLTAFGLSLLAGAVVSETIALHRARSGSIAPRSGGGTKTHLAHGAEHLHTFTNGTWVVFYEVGQDAPLAQSPVVFDPGCTVRLRRCPADGDRLVSGTSATFVEVIPSA